jgi:hypothetical protein
MNELSADITVLALDVAYQLTFDTLAVIQYEESAHHL